MAVSPSLVASEICELLQSLGDAQPEEDSAIGVSVAEHIPLEETSSIEAGPEGNLHST